METWKHKGNFVVTKYMVDNGRFIKGKIPTIVTGFFSCKDIHLTSLEGCPKEVRGNFYCSYNQLTSLRGSPNIIGGHFYCGNNELVSLEGIPENFKNYIVIASSIKSINIQKEFINSRNFKTDYYTDLLKYCLNERIDPEEINTWPKGFLTTNTINSFKGICKFNL